MALPISANLLVPLAAAVGAATLVALSIFAPPRTLTLPGEARD
ncbi:hypothetical protein [Nocardia transvalensis]|nr:hypothetical protein [Nocardia transvalensis]